MQPSTGKCHTYPQVFIIESLRPSDKKAGRLEGKIIESVLTMGGKSPLYRFVETIDELEDAAAEFDASRYRYLHLSCHGNASAFEFYFGSLKFVDFAKMFHGKLQSRRLFISACKCVTFDLVKLLIPSGCISVIGPYNYIDFDVAAVIWASYDYLSFRDEQSSMNRSQVIKRLQKLTSLFRVNLNYYSGSKARGILRKRLIGKPGIRRASLKEL